MVRGSACRRRTAVLPRNTPLRRPSGPPRNWYRLPSLILLVEQVVAEDRETSRRSSDQLTSRARRAAHSRRRWSAGSRRSDEAAIELGDERQVGVEVPGPAARSRSPVQSKPRRPLHLGAKVAGLPFRSWVERSASAEARQPDALRIVGELGVQVATLAKSDRFGIGLAMPSNSKPWWRRLPALRTVKLVPSNARSWKPLMFIR